MEPIGEEEVKLSDETKKRAQAAMEYFDTLLTQKKNYTRERAAR